MVMCVVSRRRQSEISLKKSSGSVLLVRHRFWSLWNGDRVAASARPSSRGRWYYIEEGFSTVYSSSLNTLNKPEYGEPGAVVQIVRRC